MVDRPEYTEGQRVCIIGLGSDRMAHRHGAVERLTKTLIVVKTDRGFEERFNREFHYSTPRSDWGGTHLYPTCQRPRKRS